MPRFKKKFGEQITGTAVTNTKSVLILSPSKNVAFRDYFSV